MTTENSTRYNELKARVERLGFQLVTDSNDDGPGLYISAVSGHRETLRGNGARRRRRLRAAQYVVREDQGAGADEDEYEVSHPWTEKCVRHFAAIIKFMNPVICGAHELHERPSPRSARNTQKPTSAK